MDPVRRSQLEIGINRPYQTARAALKGEGFTEEIYAIAGLHALRICRGDILRLAVFPFGREDSFTGVIADRLKNDMNHRDKYCALVCGSDLLALYYGDLGLVPAAGITAELGEKLDQPYLKAVSYTHLDVYKRQGQYSPTTPQGERGTTAPYGTVERPFDIAALAAGAGASFTARGSAFHAMQTIKMIEQGISHKGFSLIDCASVCPTYYGRKNKKGDAVEMMKWQRDNAVMAEKAAGMTEEEKRGKLVIGVLSRSDYPEFTAEYQKIIDRLAEGRK